MSGFLSLIHTWWTIVNCRQRYSPNNLGNAIVCGDDKVQFLEAFAHWLDDWRSNETGIFCLSRQTFDALIRTLRAQSQLVRDLLSDGYEYVIMGKFQSDPLERRFSQYRQMSGGRFLVALREVLCTENILKCTSLLKAGIQFWDERALRNTIEDSAYKVFCDEVDAVVNELCEVCLSPDTFEVSYVVAGYIVRKILKRLQCPECASCLVAQKPSHSSYFNELSRGGLTIPSDNFAQFVSTSFAVLDASSEIILRHAIPTKCAAVYVLKTVLLGYAVGCHGHSEQCSQLAFSVVVNIFFNNKQKLTNASLRKDNVAAFKQRQRQKQK